MEAVLILSFIYLLIAFISYLILFSRESQFMVGGSPRIDALWVLFWPIAWAVGIVLWILWTVWRLCKAIITNRWGDG